jgi:hypothetical protein
MQTAQEPADRTGSPLEAGMLTAVDEPQSARELDAGFDFRVRAERDADVIRVGLRTSTTLPFGDIRRNRNRRSSQLTGESVSLFSRKRRSRFVALLDENHRLLPRFKLAIR